ncbi:unnamed protein product [Cylindrotheca closterium]|uniref:Uncharacterized protein n=1 Tax=Cylindrotheca closterium TaxID=2856 RepID=A0AAD2CE36_9STRA|nr:unnamed protein product [Cylindrotheca closterium]
MPISDVDAPKHQVAIKSIIRAVESNRSEGSSENSFSCCGPLVRLLVRSGQSKDCDDIVPGLTYKQQRDLIISSIQTMSKKQSNRFFGGLKKHVEGILVNEAYVPSSVYNETSGGDKDSAIIPDDESTKCLCFLKCAAICVGKFLEGRLQQEKERGKPTGLELSIVPQVYEVASNLHKILFSLHVCGPDGISTQDSVLEMCEKWWLSNGENKESLIAQCLPLIVLKALDDTEFQSSHVKRLFKLREAFLVIDFKNHSSDSLRSLLLRIASNPLLLKLPEGKKFLSCLLRDPDLITDLHISFRAQIPMSKKTALQSYGEIYLWSWRDASQDAEELRETIEHTALQDLMYASIHVSSEATLKSVMTVLDVFFFDKKNTEIASLLYRLYNPILWRSLSATNPLVRKNAVRILEKIFPLHDPTTSDTRNAMDKAIKALDSALQDKDITVRIVAADATAKIAVLFWDVLPASAIRSLLNHIIIGHASDASSVAVRVAALEAIISLLDIPQSHAVLRPLLPSLGNLVHDKSERVRSSALKMLLKVKEIRGIRYFHVVPVSHLTARLSEETRLHHDPRNAISRQLTALMLNSYFPQGPNVSGADQLQRTLTFFHTDPDAAVAFYANLVDLLDMKPLVKFIAMLLTCLKSAVEVEQAKVSESAKSKKKRRRSPIQEQEGGATEKLVPSNIAFMEALTETLCIMVESIMPRTSADCDDDCNNLLLQQFSDVGFVNILVYFGQLGSELHDYRCEEASGCLRTSSSLLRCMSHLPKETVDGIADFVFASMTSWNQEYQPPHLVLSHLAPLCVWGMTVEVTETLARSIQVPFKDENNIFSPLSISLDETATAHRRTSIQRQSSHSTIIPEQDPYTALEVINTILQSSDPSSTFLKDQILTCEKSCASIKLALERGIALAEKVFQADTNFGNGYRESHFEYILCMCETYGKFVLHKVATIENSDEYRSQMKTLLEWTTEKALVAFLTARPEGNELRQLDLSRISNVSDSMVLSPPRQKVDLRRTPTRLGRPSFASGSDVPPFLLTSFTASLLQSACILFAEELALGSANSNDIADAAIIWCKVFGEANKESNEGAEYIIEGMVPSFFRLAIQLCKSSSNFLLLKELLTSCQEKTLRRVKDHVKKAISSLLHGRFGEQSNLTDGIIETVISAAANTPSDTDETILETDTFWTTQNGCVGLALEAIFTSKTAAMALVQRLTQDLCLVADETTTVDMFKLRCLQELMSRSSLAAEKTKRDLTVDQFKEGSKMRGYVQKLFETAS